MYTNHTVASHVLKAGPECVLDRLISVVFGEDENWN
jgi:hypothetical protein